MRKHSKTILLLTAFLFAVGCNGKKNGTTPRGTGDGQGGDIDMTAKPRPKKRRLSKRAKKAFKKAKQNLDRILKGVSERGGKWKQSDCRKVAEAFARIAKENAGEKDAVAKARFNEGVAWSKCGDDDKAQTAYRAALSANPRYAPAKVNMAEYQTRQGNVSAAWETFLAAFLANPEDLDANYNLAVLLEKKERKGERAPPRLKRFWKKLKFDPRTAGDVAELHLRMVLAKSSAGKTMRAATLNLKAYSLLALVYFQQSKRRRYRSKLTLAGLVLKEALKVLKKPAVKGKYCKDPENPTGFDVATAQLRNITGLILLRRERLVEAMYRFEAALKCNADFVEAHMNRAAIALGFRGYWIAHDSFTRVLKLQPKNVDAIIGLGVAYRGIATDPDRRGRKHSKDEWYAKATAQYKKALQINPKATDAIYNLGHLNMDYLNNIKKAEKWYKKYLAKPKRVTARKARKDAKEQLDEIAYQRKVMARMKKMKSKMERLRKKREREKREREAAMSSGGMKAGGMKAGGMKAGGMKAGGMKAGGMKAGGKPPARR